MEKNDCYVYGHVDPRNDTPLYIGAGRGNRAWQHFSHCYYESQPAYNSYYYRKLRKLLAAGVTPVVRLLVEDVSRYEAFEVWERFFITAIGRKDLGTGPLYNLTDGGEGANAISPESRARGARIKRLRSAMRGKKYKGTICRKLKGKHYPRVVLNPLWPATKGEIKQLAGFDTEEEAALAYNHAIDTYLDGEGSKNTLPDDFRPGWADMRPQHTVSSDGSGVLEILDTLNAVLKTDSERRIFAEENWGLPNVVVSERLGMSHQLVAQVRDRVRKRYKKLETANE